MPPRIDVHGLRITDGECAWAFEVDCRIDCARIQLNGVDYSVRPLRWRDKQVLARLSALGEAFLKREFVRLSLTEPATLPTGKDDLALLFELARWYNSPDGQEMLPFDPTTLSMVTMRLCQSMRLAPKHFDQRNSSEIERLWRIAANSLTLDEQVRAPMPTHTPGVIEARSATKIVILPDSTAPKLTATAEMNSQNFEDNFSSAETTDQTTFIPPQQSPLKTNTSSNSIDADDKLELTESGPRGILAAQGAQVSKLEGDSSAQLVPLSSELAEVSEIGAAVKQSGGSKPSIKAIASQSKAIASQRKTASARPSSILNGPGSDALGSESSDSNLLTKSPGELAPVLKSSAAWSRQGNRFRSESLPPNSIKSVLDRTESPNATPDSEFFGEGSFGTSTQREHRFRTESLLPNSIESISGGSASLEGKHPSSRSSGGQRYSPGLPLGTTPEVTDLGFRDSRVLLMTLPRASHDCTNTLEQDSPPPSAQGNASATDFSDVENIFDELAERLAQSAMQLGIDVEY